MATVGDGVKGLNVPRLLCLSLHKDKLEIMSTVTDLCSLTNVESSECCRCSGAVESSQRKDGPEVAACHCDEDDTSDVRQAAVAAAS